MARTKSIEKENTVIDVHDTNNIFEDYDVRKEIDNVLEENTSKLKKIVNIKPCHSDLFNGSIMFQNTKLILKILKNKDGSYNFPLSKDINEFKKKYPSMIRFVSDSNKWNESAINEFQIVITNNGMTLNINENYDLFIYDLLKLYPDIGTELKPVNNIEKFYIEDLEANARQSSVTYKVKKECFDIFDKMSYEDKLYYNAYLGKNTINISNEVLNSNIINYIESKPDEFMRLYKTIDIIRDYGLVGLLIERGIIEKKEGMLYYNEINLGGSLKDVVSFLSKPTNVDIRLTLRSKLPL